MILVLATGGGGKNKQNEEYSEHHPAHSKYVYILALVFTVVVAHPVTEHHCGHHWLCVHIMRTAGGNDNAYKHKH